MNIINQVVTFANNIKSDWISAYGLFKQEFNGFDTISKLRQYCLIYLKHYSKEMPYDIIRYIGILYFYVKTIPHIIQSLNDESFPRIIDLLNDAYGHDISVHMIRMIYVPINKNKTTTYIDKIDNIFLIHRLVIDEKSSISYLKILIDIDKEKTFDRITTIITNDDTSEYSPWSGAICGKNLDVVKLFIELADNKEQLFKLLLTKINNQATVYELIIILNKIDIFQIVLCHAEKLNIIKEVLTMKSNPEDDNCISIKCFLMVPELTNRCMNIVHTYCEKYKIEDILKSGRENNIW